MNQNILNWLNDNKRVIAEVILVLIIICGCLYEYESKHQAELGKATQLTETQMKDINSLQNLLDINKQNAEELKKQFELALTGQIQPINHFNITAHNLTSATQQVQDRINNNDSTLPSSALAKTDRTVITAQPNNQQYQVGVYKINLYPKNLVTIGANQNTEMIGYSVRVNVPKIPLIVPHGATGYVGATVIHNKNSNEALATITIPL